MQQSFVREDASKQLVERNHIIIQTVTYIDEIIGKHGSL